MAHVINWSGPQKCHWSGCASRATFQSPSSLKTHIDNMHVSPLVCTHPGCPYKKPFGKEYNLKRHVAEMHTTERMFQCLDGDCQETFARKDKMLNHAREKHELFKCSCSHCAATVFAAERDSHLRESHGSYECVIGSCQSGGRSHFQKVNLQRHLRTAHRIHYDRTNEILHDLSSSSTAAEKTEVLYARAELRRAYRDCASCSAE